MHAPARSKCRRTVDDLRAAANALQAALAPTPAPGSGTSPHPPHPNPPHYE